MDKYRVVRKHSSDQNSSDDGYFRYRSDAQQYVERRVSREREGFVDTPVRVCVLHQHRHAIEWQVQIMGSAPFSITYTIEDID